VLTVAFEDLVKIEVILILVVIGALFFVAGRTITGMVVHNDEDPIQKGMTMGQVKTVAGEPLDKYEIWHYEDREVTFRDGVVSSTR